MTNEFLEQITTTIEGYEVKELRYKKLDNLIVGRVKCPVIGNPALHNGFVVCCWRPNGTLHPRYGGTTRPDLYLKFPI
jgi:hypothetical protein